MRYVIKVNKSLRWLSSSAKNMYFGTNELVECYFFDWKQIKWEGENEKEKKKTLLRLLRLKKRRRRKRRRVDDIDEQDEQRAVK